jgi:hypothetical protein
VTIKRGLESANIPEGTKFVVDAHAIERRLTPRIICDFSAIVRGFDPQGQKFEEKARVINLSATGIYVQILCPIQIGANLSVQVAFPTGSLRWGTSNLDLQGSVVRSEMQSDGVSGIAIRFYTYRFT